MHDFFLKQGIFSNGIGAELWVGNITAVYWIPLVSGLGWRGIRFTSIEANPLARVRDTLETRWEVVIPSSWPDKHY